MNTNPFDRADLGYESLFGARTMFYHLQPNASEAAMGDEVVRRSEAGGEKGILVEKLQVPVLDLEGTRWVEGVTVGVVVLGCLWVGWVLVGVAFRGFSGPRLGANGRSSWSEKKKKKKKKQ